MKKIFSIIYVFAALAVLSSCTDLFSIDNQPTGESITEGKVLVEFSVRSTDPQVVTKTLANDPNITSIKLVVYDQNGVYVEQIDATLDPTDNASGKWKANLSLSDSPRYIHFLGNYTETVPFGTEVEIISQLSTDDDAYWQRVYLPKISSTLVGDPAYLQFDQYSYLENIILVRNYSKVTLTANLDSGTTAFEITSAALYNIPDHGTVAPYSASNSSFVVNYQNYTTPAALQATPTPAYATNIPKTFSLTSPDTSDFIEDVSGVVTMYMFEKEIPLDDASFIIVKGKFDSDGDGVLTDETDTYYKINLKDDDGNYYPIFRNFEYKINIRKVSAPGLSSLDDAVASPGSGDISTDTRYKSLTNISNGEARIFVSHTEMVLVSSNAVQVKYSFIPDLSYPSTVDNSSTAVTISQGPASTLGAVFSSVTCDQTVVADGFTTITITPNAPNEYAKKQTLIITGHYTDSEGQPATISREVVFTLREKPQLTLTCLTSAGVVTSEIAKTKETPFILRIGIPDGLAESMFPLDLAIEAKERTISSNTSIAGASLPCTTKPSLFSSTAPGIQFVKTISYAEYTAATADSNGYKHFDTYFKTNAAVSATEVKVANDYFFDGRTYFKNTGDADSFSGLSFSKDLRIGTGTLDAAVKSRTTDFTFFMTSDDDVTVTISGANYTGSEMTGSSGTYTYTPTASGLQTIHGLVANTYGGGITVSLSATGYASKSLTEYRYGIVRANSVQHTTSDLTNNFGITSWSGDKGSAELTATFTGTPSFTFKVPIVVTRSGTENNFNAPTGSVERRNGSGSGKRNYRYTISNYSSDYNYYYSETNPGTDLTIGTLISDISSSQFTIGNNDQPNSKTIYIRAERKINGKTSSGWSTFAYNGSSNVTQDSQGKYYTNLRYSFTGPEADTQVDFNGAVTSSTQTFSLTYGTDNFGSITVSALE